MSRKKKLLIVVTCEIVVYFLVYLVEPFMIDFFDLDGDFIRGGWVFYDIVGAYVNLVVVPIITTIVMNFWVDEYMYWLTWIPVYILMKYIYYPEEAYIEWFGIDDLEFDFAVLVIIVLQFLCWFIVKLTKFVKKKLNKRKKSI